VRVLRDVWAVPGVIRWRRGGMVSVRFSPLHPLATPLQASFSALFHGRVRGGVCAKNWQRGDDSGTNPQNGQKPTGALTDVVQTTLWAAGPDTRVGSTFDIEVTVTPIMGYTEANLWRSFWHDSEHAGCNGASCDCVSHTITTPLPGASAIFHLPLPSTTCQ
jgi:hypothetical protein